MTKVVQHCAVMHRSAADLNDQLTIVLTAAARAIEAADVGDPLLPMLQELRMAAERCAVVAGRLICYSLRNGVRCPRSTAEQLVEADT